jgi:hypothetical protein
MYTVRVARKPISHIIPSKVGTMSTARGRGLGDCGPDATDATRLIPLETLGEFGKPPPRTGTDVFRYYLRVGVGIWRNIHAGYWDVGIHSA